MAPTFGRSISIPLSPARSRAAARHVRSTSLPTSRAHPLLAHLQNAVRAVRDWTAQPASASSGLAHIDALHAALAELLLLHPEARAALRSGSATADCLLDAFLALADAHGTFQEAVLDLKRFAAEVQAALRRRDAARLASAVRAQRQAEKRIARLASSVRGACKWPLQIVVDASVEVSGVLAEAVDAVASASAAVFSAVEFVSSAATTAAASSSSSKKSSAGTIVSLVKKATSTRAACCSSNEDKEMAALQRLQDLQVSIIPEIESRSDKVFRIILHTRVALLNIQAADNC